MYSESRLVLMHDSRTASLMNGCSSPRVSVVVPLFNEVESVEPLYRELTAALERASLEYELVLVDDGSSDGTSEELQKLGRLDHRVLVVRFRSNFGQTAAIQAGFDFARGQVVVTIDGDLQNDPADIPYLVAELGDAYDVVTGWRKDRQDRALSRRLPSVIANWLIGLVTGVRIHDNGCTLKAYRLEIVKKAGLYAEMHRFLVPMLTLSGCRIKEVVVNHRSRQFGTSKYGLSRVWKVFLDLIMVKMVLRFASHPAAWFGLMAAPFLSISAISSIVGLALYANLDLKGDFPIVVPGIVCLSMFLTVHLLLLGMIAELVVKTGDFRESEPMVFRTCRSEHPSS